MSVINPIVVQSGGGGGGFEFFGNLTIVMYKDYDFSYFSGVDKIQYSFDGGTTWSSPTEGPVGVETEKVFQTPLPTSFSDSGKVMIRSTDGDSIDCVWSVTSVFVGTDAGSSPEIQSYVKSGAATQTITHGNYGAPSKHCVVVFFGHTEHN